MKITNAKKLIPAVNINVLISENSKYLHRKSINVPVPIQAVKKFQLIKIGKAFAIMSASFSKMMNIPSDESTRYSDNGK